MYPAPIACLPLEILEHIFSLCLSWIHPDNAASAARPRPKHPLAFTAVSRIWRWTALSSPRLWSLIDLANVPLTQYSLHTQARRPTTAPLTVSRLANTCVRLVSIVGGIKLLFPKCTCARRHRHISQRATLPRAAHDDAPAKGTARPGAPRTRRRAR